MAPRKEAKNIRAHKGVALARRMSKLGIRAAYLWRTSGLAASRGHRDSSTRGSDCGVHSEQVTHTSLEPDRQLLHTLWGAQHGRDGLIIREP